MRYIIQRLKKMHLERTRSNARKTALRLESLEHRQMFAIDAYMNSAHDIIIEGTSGNDHNFSPRVLLKMAWGKHRPLTKQKHRAYQSPFGSRDERYGLLAFKDILLNFQQPCWNLHNELQRLRQLPVLLGWGMKDSFVSPRNLERWLSIFPQAEFTKLENVGHFVADEAEELVTPIFHQFWSKLSCSCQQCARN